MIFKNVSKEDLERALKMVNKKYHQNITFKRGPEPKGKRWLITLTVNNANKKKGTTRGARLGPSGLMGYGSIHHIAAACWHVHGDFFDILWDIQPKMEVRGGGFHYTNPTQNWQNRNIGSIMYPVYFSEACDCGK